MIARRGFIISIYVLTLVFLYADHNLLSPNLSQIAKEFGMTEDERDEKIGGQISLAFFIVGVPSSLLFGWLADKTSHRGTLFAIVVLISETACLGTFFVPNFEMLFLTRTVTGVGIGGSVPIIYSVLGDLYQVEGRNAAAAIVSSATGLGLGLGQGLAGFVGPAYGWRLPFLLVSVPAFVFATLCFFLEESERGSKESVILLTRVNEPCSNEVINDELQSHNYNNCGENEKYFSMSFEDSSLGPYGGEHDGQSGHGKRGRDDIEDDKSEYEPTQKYVAEKVTLSSTCKLFKTRTVILILLQGSPSVFTFGIASTFLNDYLSEEKGLTVEEDILFKQATGILLIFGAGNAIGIVIGGALGHFLYKMNCQLPPIAMGVSIILSCIPMWFIINMDYSGGTKVLFRASVIIFLAGVLSVLPLPIERAMLNNVTLPELRGRANSFLSIIDNVGKAFGPFVLSNMISAMDRQAAFNWSLVGSIVGGFIALLMYFTVKKDEEYLQHSIQEKLDMHCANE